jgi:hypothetical protein
LHAKAFDEDVSGVGAGPLVKKEERRSLVVTEYGEISATEIIDGMGALYHLQFLTLEPNSLFLPVLLHADMVFFVNTGALSFIMRSIIYIYLRSTLNFIRAKHCCLNLHGLSVGIYYSIG